MQGASLILTSYQDSLQTAMSVIANNVANINTTGFKKETVAFDSYLSQPTPKDSFRFALEDGTYRDTAQGAINVTGNPLDMAIQGNGYFAVQTPAGVRYTRAGAFQLNPDGDLITASGNRVLADGGQTITFPIDAKDILIGGDGTISATSGESGTVTELGRISVLSFKNEMALETVGGGLYAAKETPQPSTTSHVVQGSVERSNVQGVEEMTRMIEISRAYQRITNLLEREHQRQTSALQRLGKISA